MEYFSFISKWAHNSSQETAVSAVAGASRRSRMYRSSRSCVDQRAWSYVRRLPRGRAAGRAAASKLAKAGASAWTGLRPERGPRLRT
eukprot:10252604-Lingulodinium_polyedra.AAC.1